MLIETEKVAKEMKQMVPNCYYRDGIEDELSISDQILRWHTKVSDNENPAPSLPIVAQGKGQKTKFLMSENQICSN